MNQWMNFRADTTSSTSNANYYTAPTAVSSFISSANIVFNSSVPCEAPTEINSNNGKYSVYTIAAWFLTKANMTHKKLQKLCYYAQAWCYALRGFRLEDTDYQAWVHGPVSPALYDRFKCFGYDTIHMKSRVDLKIDVEDISLLEDIWDTYGDKTGNALEALSHRETPWLEARRGYAADERCSVVINPETMRDYYRSIYIGAK